VALGVGDLLGQTIKVCSCNRTDQIIRAQVQKQAPKHSNF
jgi:hypothetical protein